MRSSITISNSNKNLALVVEHDNNIKKNKFDAKLFFFILKKFSFFDPFWKNSYIPAKKILLESVE